MKDRTKFNMDEVKRALGSRYGSGARLLAGPTDPPGEAVRPPADPPHP